MSECKERLLPPISLFQLEEALQDAWGDHCSETGCHPQFITHHGKKLEANFIGSSFTAFVFDMLCTRATPSAPTDEAVEIRPMFYKYRTKAGLIYDTYDAACSMDCEAIPLYTKEQLSAAIARERERADMIEKERNRLRDTKWEGITALESERDALRQEVERLKEELSNRNAEESEQS